MEFEEILKRRRSVRKFTDQQVREETIVQIINESRQAPSWANAQETKIYVATKNVAKMIRKEFLEGDEAGVALSDYSFTHREDWSLRERKAMKTFDGQIGNFVQNDYLEFIEAQDTLFNAPCIVYLTLPNDASTWSKSDLGAFEMMILLCAADKGVDSIVAQAFVKYPEIIRKHMDIPDDEEIIIGIGLGYEEECRLNEFRSPRKTLTNILTIKE